MTHDAPPKMTRDWNAKLTWSPYVRTRGSATGGRWRASDKSFLGPRVARRVRPLLACVLALALAGCSAPALHQPAFLVVRVVSSLQHDAPPPGSPAVTVAPCDPIEPALAVDLARQRAEMSDARGEHRPFDLLVLDEVSTGRADAGCSELPLAWTGNGSVAWARLVDGQRLAARVEARGPNVTFGNATLAPGASADVAVEGAWHGNLAVTNEGGWPAEALAVSHAVNATGPPWRTYWWPAG
jgi:hypothetical protein